MIINDFEDILKKSGLEIKGNNYDDIFNLYKGNEYFAKISKNYPVTFESIRADVDTIPDFTDNTKKHYLSIYNNSKLIAVLDFIEEYSYQDKNDNQALWIGLLQIEYGSQKLGLGHIIMESFLKACIHNSKRIIQLGVIKENEKALSFWNNLGFKVFKETHSGELELYLMEKLIV